MSQENLEIARALAESFQPETMNLRSTSTTRRSNGTRRNGPRRCFPRRSPGATLLGVTLPAVVGLGVGSSQTHGDEEAGSHGR
jgi:hypothetical protein